MRLLILLLLTCLALSPARANPFATQTAQGDNPFGSSQSRSIPSVDQAMPLTVTQAANDAQLVLHFALLDHVYLYRPQLKLTPLDANKAPLAFVTAPLLPAGSAHEDDVYGKTEVYFHQLTLSLAAAIFPPNASYLRVQYQGCLENVLCYAPQQKDIPLAGLVGSTKAASESSSVATTASSSSAASPSLTSVLKSADASQFASWANSQSLASVLLLFFVGGLLMAFTPCVFPMFPILLGILAGERNPRAARGFAVSLAYVLGMAVPYTLAGLLVALSGARFNIQAWLQQPAAIIVAALIFVLLALSMFGLFELQLPAKLRSRLGTGSSNGTLTQAAIMGAISSLIVSPCITPVLAGALLFVAAQGQLLSGALALFVLALGMGVPLLIIGAGGASLLPRAGNFMEDIKRFFGLVLLLMAAWLLSRILGTELALWMYGSILLVYAVILGAFDGSKRLRQGLALLLFAYALLLLVGAASGGSSVLTPLANLSLQPATIATSPTLTTPTASSGQFTEVKGADLDSVLAAARNSKQPVLVDFFADWCTACKELDKTTLSDPTVLAAMQGLRLLRVNITDINAENRQLMQQYQILGLPCLVFFDSSGAEITAARVLGYMNSAQWLDHLNNQVLPEI